MKRFNRLKNRKGVALLITIGILAIMSIIATSFSFSMKLESETAVNFTRSVKALYTAQSGTNKVIADIRSQVISSTYINLISYINSYNTSEQTLTGQGTYQITIGNSPYIGEDQKVNLNALDDTDAVWIGRLQTAGLTYDDISQIIDYRDTDSDVTSQLYTTGGWVTCAGNETNTKNSNFTSVEEVTLIVGDTKYNNIKNEVTIYGPIIRGGLLAEYYDSISGSSPNVQITKSSFVGKIIEPGEVCEFHWEGWGSANSMPGTDGQLNGWIETRYAEWSGGYLLSGTGEGRLDTYGVIFEGYIDVLPSETGSAVTFYLRAEDGAKLFIDGTTVITAWYDKASMDPEVSGAYTFNYPGWHPIRIEYYANTGENSCALKWSLSGADDISAGAGNYVPAERLGFAPIITHPEESSIAYPSAGNYIITSVGKVQGPVLAEKKIATAVKIFGVWTQTTREDFSAPWVSDPGTISGTDNAEKYFPGNYQDGHVFNVNWLNSCPDNASANLEAGGYTTTVNALKLGYWDDFEEDLAYSTVNLMALGKQVIEGLYIQKRDAAYPSDWRYEPYRNNTNPASSGYFALTYDKLDSTSVGGNATTKIAVDNEAFTEYFFEANYNYYRPVTNVFARAWTSASEYPSNRIGWRGNANVVPSGDWSKVKPADSGGEAYYYYDLTTPPPNTDGPGDPDPVFNAYNNPSVHTPDVAARVKIYGGNPPYLENSYDAFGAYWQPLTYYLNPFLYGRGERRDPNQTTEYDLSGRGHYVVLDDGDDWTYRAGDRLEIDAMNYQIAWTALSPNPYDPTNILGMIKQNSSAAYRAYLDGGVKTVELTPTGSPLISNFKFKSTNTYDLSGWYRKQAVWIRGAPLDSVTHYFDNIRFIPDNGILVSTPFDPGESVTWGRVSWTEKNAADASLDIIIGLRTAASKAALPTTDTGWTSVTNGAQITNTGRWLQYKATLTSIAFDRTNYANSAKTAIFQDITITYLPRVEILYYKEITE